MKTLSLIILIALFFIIACRNTKSTKLLSAHPDSLAKHVEKVLEQKKHLLELKREFERSRYNKSLLKYRPIIRKYAKRYGFDWRLIVAQIMQESRFRESARSPVGARGLMQLMPKTAKELTRELDAEFILKNPRENIVAGIYHLRKQFGLFSSADLVERTKLSLASYNCGAGRVLDAQSIARFYERPPNKWSFIQTYITMLKSTDWELHLQIWPQGRPIHGYFYGYDETINYVNNIWDMYELYRKIL
jgi:membrane-bound lytic murein transglycosylase F